MRRVFIHSFQPALMVKKIVPDMLVLLALVLLGTAFFCCLDWGGLVRQEGALLLAGGVKMGARQ